jgi:hypothetical protein
MKKIPPVEKFSLMNNNSSPNTRNDVTTVLSFEECHTHKVTIRNEFL